MLESYPSYEKFEFFISIGIFGSNMDAHAASAGSSEMTFEELILQPGYDPASTVQPPYQPIVEGNDGTNEEATVVVSEVSPYETGWQLILEGTLGNGDIIGNIGYSSGGNIMYLFFNFLPYDYYEFEVWEDDGSGTGAGFEDDYVETLHVNDADGDGLSQQYEVRVNGSYCDGDNGKAEFYLILTFNQNAPVDYGLYD